MSQPSQVPGGYRPPPPGPVAVAVGGFRTRLMLWILVVLAGTLVVMLAMSFLPVLLGAPSVPAVILSVVSWFVPVPAVILIVMIIRRQRQRGSVIEVGPAGLTRRATAGPVWALRWSELWGVAITTAYHTSRYGIRRYRMRLILTPWDASLTARHPQLAEWQGQYGAHPTDVGIPLGLYSQLGALDGALRQFAGPLYHGMVQEGMVLGFGYD